MRYIILGGGPAGLTFANLLLAKGNDDFIVIEKENIGGGLCRSVWKDEAPWDIGGGHFLDTRRKEVLDFLFMFMPQEEWNRFERDSRIQLGENMINSPIEANIWQLPITMQVEYLKEIAIAGCNIGRKKPEDFLPWIEWKLGKKIAADYMIPYNQKMFGDRLNELGTYWLEKLPNVSFEETLMSCLERKAYGKQPGHAVFLYPKKYGYGELWKRMADRLGNRICYGETVRKLDILNHTVNDKWSGDRIVITIPWTDIEIIKGLPERIQTSLTGLHHTGVVTEYKNVLLDTDAQWIYLPNLELDYHRILVRKNFYPEAKGYWTETNKTRFSYPNDSQDYYVNDYAYPLNTINKPEIMRQLLDFASKYNVFGLGRWGEWEHYNSDVVVERAMKLVDSLQ